MYRQPFFYLLFIVLLASCEKEQAPLRHITFSLSNNAPEENAHDWEVIIQRLNYNHIPISAIKKIDDHTISASVDVTIDSALFKSIIERRGVFSIQKTFNNKEVKKYIDKLYEQALVLDLVPEWEDEFVQKKNKDLNNFLLRQEIDSIKGLNPVIGKVGVEHFSMLSRILNNKKLQEVLPDNVVLKWKDNPEERVYDLIAVEKPNPETVSNQWIDEVLVLANGNGKYSLVLDMEEEYKKPLFTFTKRNIGKTVSVILDDQILAYATIEQSIENGRIEISNAFNDVDAESIHVFIGTGVLLGNVSMSDK